MRFEIILTDYEIENFVFCEIKFTLHVPQHISYPEGIFHSKAISLAVRQISLKKALLAKCFFLGRGSRTQSCYASLACLSALGLAPSC